MDAGILPVKRLDRAKQRLVPHVTEDERHAIAEALLEDALDLCAAADGYTWWVVSDDEAVLARARERGLETVVDPGEGLNAALSAAIGAASAAGAESVTIIPTDVPLAWTGDLQDIADTGATSDVVVVPARDGGTNALYLSPPDVIEPHFGEHSFKEHLRAAEERGKRCAILALTRLELDIDTIEDVDAFLSRPKAAETRSSVLLAQTRASGKSA